MTQGSKSQPVHLMSRYELRERYADIPKGRPAPEINPNDVPEKYHELIPLAEKWGIIEDDWQPRNIMEEDAPREELENIVEKVEPYAGDILQEWLAGPESTGPDFSLAYIAFSELVCIVYSEAEAILNLWDTYRVD